MPNLVRFGYYEVDLCAGQLFRHGSKVKLRDQSFQVLAALLEHPGEVVSREELRRRLWHEEVFVDFDNNLNAAVGHLREALNDSADHPHFIETLPKRGYRFLETVSGPPLFVAAAPLKRSRLVVLPFLNLSGDPTQEYFSDAMTDEVITELAAWAPEQLAVIARTTAMRYKGCRKDVSHIARELAVDYVVEGGVLRNHERVYVNLQLIQTADQTHLFARKYDIGMSDIFSLHSWVAQDLARHVPVIATALSRGAILPERVRRKPTEDLAAYNEYIKGRYEMWKMTGEGTAEARRHFEAALARDPDFPFACNALAELYWYLGLLGYAPSRETDLLGRSYALRAMEVDSKSAETHVLMSFYPGKRDGGNAIDYYDWEQIQKAVARARELDSTLRLVRLRHAMVQGVLGRIEEATAELERMLESDPLSFDARCWLIMVLYLGRHFERALAEAFRISELEPDHFLPHYQLGYVYLGMRRFDESAASFQKAVEMSHELPMMLGWLALSLGTGGHKLQARAVLGRLSALSRQRYVAPTCLAWAHLGLGNIDEAFLWLDRAVDAPDRMIEPIKTYPFLDPLRDDPRFHALLRKMNLDAAG